MPIKAFKYRIYPNKATAEKLAWTLERCRELYNAALAERKEAWRMAGLSISVYDQEHDLIEIRNVIRPEYREVGSNVVRDVVRRVDKAYQAFFRRVKNGENPGHPRFKGHNWYDSFTYPDHNNWKLDERSRPAEKRGRVASKLHLSKIGVVKLHLHRNLEGKIKTLTIKREGEHWYAVFNCEIGRSEPLPTSYEDVGIDLGVTHFAALSTGEFIDHPRYFKRGHVKLAKAQQALSRKKRGSHRRRRAVKQVAKHHRKIRNQRRDFHHKASYKLVNRYQVIVFEDLQTANLVKRPKPKQDEQTGEYLPNGAAAKSGLTKSILDAGWGTFTEMTRVKAESAGRTVLFVNPYMTSQLCSGCGAVVRKELADRWHSCECGVELDRDTNSAKLILARGYKQLSGRAGPTERTSVKASHCM